MTIRPLLLALLCACTAFALEYQISTTGSTKILCAPGFLFIRRADWEMVIPGTRIAYLLHAPYESAFVILPMPVIKDKGSESEALIIRVRWSNDATRARLMAALATALRPVEAPVEPAPIEID